MRARYIRGTPEDRFWPKVDRRGPRPEHRPSLGRCWLWTAARNEFGYGIFRVDGRNVRAHRWAYEASVGPIAPDAELDHLCRVTACVRPSHLEPVTHQENNRRGEPGGRSWRAEITHCPAGHAYDEENTYRYRGQRMCRECRRARRR